MLSFWKDKMKNFDYVFLRFFKAGKIKLLFLVFCEVNNHLLKEFKKKINGINERNNKQKVVTA